MAPLEEIRNCDSESGFQGTRGKPRSSSPSARSTKSTSTLLAPSQLQFAEPSQTLIFFDWDDTLFPTTEIFYKWAQPRKSTTTRPLPKGLEEALQPWRQALREYIVMACALSDNCVILTNATRPWIDTCLGRFAPELVPLFEKQSNLRVVYAREVADTSERSSKDLTSAKLQAMKTEAKNFYNRYPGQSWKNIVSLGDMQYEHDAIQALASERLSPPGERFRTKALLLPSAPSLSELTLRLQFSRLLLPAYVRVDGNFRLDLRSADDPLEAIASAVRMPQLAKLPFPRHAWGRTPPPEEDLASEALDELAVTVHESLFDDATTLSIIEQCKAEGIYQGVTSQQPSPSGPFSKLLWIILHSKETVLRWLGSSRGKLIVFMAVLLFMASKSALRPLRLRFTKLLSLQQ